jgi:hypothetical protein
VAEFVLWDMIEFADRRGRIWANRAMEDAMNAVVQFMVLPRLWPPRRKLRAFPSNRFPTIAEYKNLVQPDEGDEKPKWRALRQWFFLRAKELRAEQQRS